VSELSFYVQNKSSINSLNEKAIEDLDTDDWLLFLGARVPVLIVKYDISSKEFYWEIAQNYLWDSIEREDPNWRRQKSKRIILTKKIDDLNELRDAIIASQKRITRYHSMNLDIGEGIRVNQQDLSELAKVRARALDEYKILSLKESYYLRKAGNTQASTKMLIDVYNSPKNDEAKLRAIIGLIFELNITDLGENEKAFHLANEAVGLANSLKINYLKNYAVILRNQAVLFVILKKMTAIQLGLKVQEVHGEQLFSWYYQKNLSELDESRLKVVQEINDSLLSLLSNKDVYYYLTALSNLIDTITLQVSMFSVFNRALIAEETSLRQKFIEQTESVLTHLPDIDLKKSLLRSLSVYYYWTLQYEKAVAFLSEAIRLGEMDHDKFFAEGNSKLLDRMKGKPDPYATREIKEIDDITVEEYQEFISQLLKGQGIPLEGKDKLTSTISMALRDMNPKPYFQFCEHLHIGYVNTSAVGASIGLPSMGTKGVWCEHCKTTIQAFDLNGAFELFRGENCKSCAFRKGRSADWVCQVKWVKDQMNDAQFKVVLENMRKQ
jgi:hypothetical protein